MMPETHLGSTRARARAPARTLHKKFTGHGSPVGRTEVVVREAVHRSFHDGRLLKHASTAVEGHSYPRVGSVAVGATAHHGD
jgi:hypothetical protein